MRLDKAIALTGISRRDARLRVARGRVTVNGVKVMDAGASVDDGDEIFIDGARADIERYTHIMLNKPAGYLTATEDARGGRTIMELLPESLRARKLGPVGRLDKDATGLVLMTTDGQLAHRLISPKRDVVKRYLVEVEGRLNEDCVYALSAGVAFKDFTAKPARLEILSAGESESVCRVYVTEGKYHQVKRLMASVGHDVKTLKREAIGPVALDERLKPGEWRRLKGDETDELYEIAGFV